MRKTRSPDFRQVSRRLTRLRVVAAPGPTSKQAARGWLMAGAVQIPCAIGRGGIGRSKVEGDGKTPAGRFAIAYFLVRPDAGLRPARNFRVLPIRRNLAIAKRPAGVLPSPSTLL